MYIITGGAGFIGSNIAAALEAANVDVVICDRFGSGSAKWRNIAKRQLYDIITPNALAEFLAHPSRPVEGVVHMGGVSTTTETDVDAVIKSNLRLSIDLWRHCAEKDIPFVYASSAATYGDGRCGFEDRSDADYLSRLRPMSPYAWSKHLFDRWVSRAVETGAAAPQRWAGLKFFNVYGPNEYHKGGQRSVAVQLHAQIRQSGRARLFRSESPDYADGGQLRDFVWIGDCVDATMWALLDPSRPSGLYNIGSGAARSFLDVATILFEAMGVEPHVEYIDLPPNLQDKYQYYTCATMDKLRGAGFDKPSTVLEEGLGKYVRDYLETDDPFR
ncbi:ADP-glyceromanno-heptose 6-epimerase precursor [Roseiarcus fermentans]|uniref:ADP-glyceromanno-heptose 6-epimerase n=1 Tax=Roseiarcus fermentans TaxID=1473586 RepID=A0A366FU42_9HYPH|nr:ADP-glyceromanno-heptose 6-epimerase [Roseiarcus fermentans]RBP17676.1 ADP-glyceromanno-heptose 6-epimerase precursor [Roseiarcus fermentans]